MQIIHDSIVGLREGESPKTIGKAVSQASANTPANGDYLLYVNRGILYKIDYEDFVALMAAKFPDKNIKSIPAISFISRNTAGATFQIDESSTNKENQAAYVFSATSDSHIQIMLPNDKSITTANFKVSIKGKRYTAGDANYGVAWAVQALIVNDDDAIDQAFGTAVIVSDTYTTEGDEYDSAESALITAAGTIGEKSSLYIQIYRDVSDEADTLVGSAGLLSVQVEFNLEAE